MYLCCWSFQNSHLIPSRDPPTPGAEATPHAVHTGHELPGPPRVGVRVPCPWPGARGPSPGATGDRRCYCPGPVFLSGTLWPGLRLGGAQRPHTQGQETPAAAPGPCPHPPGPGSLRSDRREGAVPSPPDPAPLAFQAVNTVPSMLQKESLQGGTRTDSCHLTGGSAQQEARPVPSYCRLIRLPETASKGRPTVCTKTRGCWPPQPVFTSAASPSPAPSPWAGTAGRR